MSDVNYDVANFTGDTPAAPPPAPPCTIYLNGGPKFEVTELDSWQWHDRGIFATGRFRGAAADEPEEDLLIPTEAIRYIKFDFAQTMPNG